jgi:hypothetical protein
MVESIHRSCLWFLRAAYRANPPRIAQDATPAEELIRVIKELRDRWLAQIEETAPKLAEYFNQAVEKRSTAALRKILLDGGFAVQFKMTPAMRDVFAASAAENLGLIRSIPARYFEEIEDSNLTPRLSGDLSDGASGSNPEVAFGNDCGSLPFNSGTRSRWRTEAHVPAVPRLIFDLSLPSLGFSRAHAKGRLFCEAGVST